MKPMNYQELKALVEEGRFRFVEGKGEADHFGDADDVEPEARAYQWQPIETAPREFQRRSLCVIVLGTGFSLCLIPALTTTVGLRRRRSTMTDAPQPTGCRSLIRRCEGRKRRERGPDHLAL